MCVKTLAFDLYRGWITTSLSHDLYSPNELVGIIRVQLRMAMFKDCDKGIAKHRHPFYFIATPTLMK